MNVKNVFGNRERSGNALPTLLLTIIVLVSTSWNAQAQSFDSGSDGTYGAINCTSGTCTLDMPPDGIFRCTTITVSGTATLKFNKNALNTPVYLLATGDINIIGSINVAGGNANSFPRAGGVGGPGGFDGGNPGMGSSVPPSDGQGPEIGRAHV